MGNINSDNIIKLPGVEILLKPKQKDFVEMVECLRGSVLLGGKPVDAGIMQHAALSVAQRVIEEFLDPAEPMLPELSGDEKAMIVALAMAHGWHPVKQQLCSEEQLHEIADGCGLLLEPELDLAPLDQRSLPDVLSGMDGAGPQSPLIDVYCTADDHTQELHDLLIVGKGFGETRELIQDIAFGAALSLQGHGLVVDGLIHLVADEGARIEALIGRRVEGFLGGTSQFRQLALDFAWHELQEAAQRSAFVRIHRISRYARDRLKERIAAFRRSSDHSPCLLAPTPAGREAATCTPVAARGHALAVAVPRSVVESYFFERTIGPLEKTILQQLEDNAKRRVRFYQEELENDRSRLSEFVDLAWKLLDDVEVVRSPVEQDYSKLGEQLRQSLDAVSQGEAVADEHVKSFWMLVQMVERFSGHILSDGSGASPQIKRRAARLKEVLDEECVLTFRVEDGFDPNRVALARPAVVSARVYLGTNLPASIKRDLHWLARARELLDNIRKARRSAALRRWTGAVVLDLVLRGHDLDFGGDAATGFAEFRAATRPLLVMALARRMDEVGELTTTIANPHLIFATLDDAETLVLAPTYFYDGANAVLTLEAGARFVGLRDRWQTAGMRVESEPAPAAGTFQRAVRRMFGLLQSAMDAGSGQAAMTSLGRTPPLESAATLLGLQPPPTPLAEPVDVAGLRVMKLSECLVLAGAKPAALLLLAETVYRATEGAEPYTERYPLNCLPDIPWQCLRLILEYQIMERQPPLAWSLYLGSTPVNSGPHLYAKLINTWYESGSDGLELAANGTLPSSQAHQRLIAACGRLCEAWEPGFVTAMGRGREGQSRKLAATRRILSGIDGADAQQLGIDVEFLRQAWARQRGNIALGTVPSMAALRRLARQIQKDGVDPLDYQRRVARELVNVFCYDGGLHSARAHELLDSVLGAEPRNR